MTIVRGPKPAIGVPKCDLFGFRLSVICSLSLLLCLGGCVDTAVELGAQQAKEPSARSARARPSADPQISPHGASLAVVNIEGPPDELGARFQRQFASAAQSRDVALLTAADGASYRLRGFLTASSTQGLTRLSYVLDLYDRHGRRVQRLADELDGKPGSDDPWRAVDEKTLDIFAERAAADVASFLATTPEAVAAAGGQAGVSVVQAEGAQGAAAPGPRAVAGNRD